MTVLWITRGPRLSNFVLILEREENRNTRRKTLEAQDRSTTGTLSHEMSLQTWFQG